jgi:hypothetical protein
VTWNVALGATTAGGAASVVSVFEQVRVLDAGALSDGELSELGLRRDGSLPEGEWFLRPDARRPEAARLQRETSVVGSLVRLHVADPSVATVVASVSVRFTDLPAIVECRSGEGRVIVSAIDPGRVAARPEPSRFLARLIGAQAVSAADRTIGVGIVALDIVERATITPS